MAWTLNDAREVLTTRLAEESTFFWTTAARTQALNDAQVIISSVTKGIPEHINGVIGGGINSLPFTGSLTSPDAASGFVMPGGTTTAIVGEAIVGSAIIGFPGGSYPAKALVVVRRDVADVLNPHWWGASVAGPRWFVVDGPSRKVYFTPVPPQVVRVGVELRVLPQPLQASNDLLFNGVPTMDKYFNPLINIAASMLLLNERFENEAERFYGLAMAELRELGVASRDIPPLPTQDKQ